MQSYIRPLFLISAPAILVSSHAIAAVADDIPACRCLENLSEADGPALDESLRREASWLVDRYCDEEIPLEVLSGSDKWLAEESCELLHASFFLETEGLAVQSVKAPIELRLRTELVYRGRRLHNDIFVDWRHDAALYARLEWTLRPRRAAALAQQEVAP